MQFTDDVYTRSQVMVYADEALDIASVVVSSVYPDFDTEAGYERHLDHGTPDIRHIDCARCAMRRGMFVPAVWDLALRIIRAGGPDHYRKDRYLP